MEAISKEKHNDAESLILLLGVRLDPQEPEMGQSTHGSITPPALHFPDTGVDW